MVRCIVNTLAEQRLCIPQPLLWVIATQVDGRTVPVNHCFDHRHSYPAIRVDSRRVDW